MQLNYMTVHIKHYAEKYSNNLLGEQFHAEKSKKKAEKSTEP